MNAITIKGVTIGEGRPGIILPIVGKERAEVLAQAENLKNFPCDMVEFRIDCFEKGYDIEAVEAMAAELSALLPEYPLLVTFRTKAEGGSMELPDSAYISLVRELCSRKIGDLVDMELFTVGSAASELITLAHGNGMYVVMSSHDFAKTPEEDELISRLRRMQELNADIPKLAVMPTSARDVLTLLSATERMATEYSNRPIITMSMGPLGVISRLAGETFGSSMTFGSAGHASAPGQVDASALKDILETLHQK